PGSFGQERLWFLDQLHPGAGLYHRPAALRLAGKLDRAALERSLNAVVQRHAVLRTSFSAPTGTPCQLVHPTVVLPLPRHDLREVPATERETGARRLLEDAARRPFDLAEAPLLRATLLQLGD